MTTLDLCDACPIANQDTTNTMNNPGRDGNNAILLELSLLFLNNFWTFLHERSDR